MKRTRSSTDNESYTQHIVSKATFTNNERRMLNFTSAHSKQHRENKMIFTFRQIRMRKLIFQLWKGS